MNHTLISDVPGEIRKLKDSCKDQLDMEHETPVDGDATGSEHSSGSAVAYEGTSTPTNRPDGATALADNAIDRGRLWLDDNFDPPMLKRWKAAAFEPVVGTHLSAYTNQDSESNAMLVSHAYLAATDGYVCVVGDPTVTDQYIRGYVGATNDPAGAGDYVGAGEATINLRDVSISFPVAAGEYFEILSDMGTSTTIRWKSFGTLSKPVDQD